VLALTADGAERLTARIQLRLDNIADNTEAVLPLIEQAKAGNAHQALGYPSWTAYVSDRFGGTLGRLDRSERRPLVLLLADQGMSTRAIGSIVGAGKSTVDRDLAGVPDGTPAPIIGTDGKVYPRPRRREREKSDRYSSALVAVLAARRNLKRFADDVSGVEFTDYEREGFNSLVESLRAALDMIHAGVNSGTWDDELANLLDGQA